MTLEVHTSELRAIDRMSPVLRQVATEGRQLGQSLSQSFSQAGESARRFNFDRAVIAGGLRELQGVASDFARAATEEAAGQERLQQAISNTGRSYDDVAGRIENLIKVGTDLSFADDQVVEGLTRLVNTTGDTTVAMDNLGLAMDLARARNIDLATAADLVGKVAAGNTSILSRYGIIIEEGATATEALAMMQQRFAGQGQTYADSTQGFIDRLSNSVADFGENLFSQNQELQTFLALMPGVNAAYSVLAGAVAGLGGFGTLAKFAGPAALLAGGASLAYGYSQTDFGTTGTNQFWNEFFLQASNALNFAVPGNPFNEQKYIDQMNANTTLDAIAQVLIAPGQSDVAGWDSVAALTGTITGEMDKNALAAFVEGEATKVGLTVGAYLISLAQSNPNFTMDPVTGVYMPAGDYTKYALQRRYTEAGGLYAGPQPGLSYGGGAYQPFDPYGGAGIYRFWAAGGRAEFGDLRPAADAYMQGGTGMIANSGLANYNAPVVMTPFDPYYGRGAFAPPGIDYGLRFPSEQAGSLPPPGGAGIVANSGLANYNAPVVLSPEMQKAADRTAIINAIGEENMAYFGLVEGINSANDATKAFHATNGLLQQSNVFQAQQSEYGGVLSDMEAGYAILQRRQAEGIELSAREQEFMQNYAKNSERMTGAVEDAVVEQALLGGQYLRNMKQGDELNRTLAGNTDATSSLVAVIYDLILAMDGIPPEVRSRIEIERAQESLGELAGIASWLNSLNGFTANAYVNVTRTGISLGSPDGVGISLNGLQLGGLIPGAAHGRVMGGGYTLVGEAGPELIAGGQGGMVIPASATRARLRGGMGGDTFQFNAPIMVYANNPQQFAAQMREQYVGGARQ